MNQLVNSASHDQRRLKLIQIFRYVQAFNHLQNPVQQEIQEQPWVMWLRHLPHHSSIRIGRHNATDTDQARKNAKENTETEDDFILKIGRSRITEAPEPPREITLWLQNGWQDIDGSVKLDTTKIHSFNDNPKRLQIFDQWVKQRNIWLETERPVRNALRLYDKLNELRAQLEREPERLELMLGDGILNWPMSNGIPVHHPILLLRLQLQFNPQIPEFTLKETEYPVEHVYALALQAQLLLVEYNPVVPEDLQGNHIEKAINRIIEYLEKGKKLTGITQWIHGDWKTVIEQAQVKGGSPETREHFIALRTLLNLRAARTDLLGRWQRQMTPLGAPDAIALGSTPEGICMQFVFQMRRCLEWYTSTWAPLEQQLRQQGLLWEILLAEMPAQIAAEYGELLRLREAVQLHLRPILEAEINRRKYQINEAKLLEMKRQLGLIESTAAKTEVVQRLRIAVDSHNVQAYKETIERLADLQGRQKEQQYRYTLLSKLEKSAPNWTAAIRRREGVHGKSEAPGEPQTAWLWRQLHDELDRRSRLSLEHVQERIVQLNNNLHDITAELVEKKAWAAQMRRTTGEQRQALNGWKELMRKAGKGTGKRSAKLIAEARLLMPKCQTAVPVWIMPLSRVVQNFNPRQNRFDVVIIDEASQADIKALAALYMGQQIVIVGDDEQVTPLAVGQKIDNIEQLIAEHLQGIPLSAMYDGKLSIYQLAKTAPGFRPICLREHFRCVSPIIQFCNNLSYNGKIKPLHDDSEVKLRPPTVAYRMESNDATGHVNEEEAVTIASLLIAATEQPEYRDATFGVISMVDDEQALHIDTLLNRYLRATEYASHQILCGNPAQFQGDERDVIFLSMVDVPKNGGPLPLRSEDSFDYMYKKRFNVAVSRARDQLWVVHSLDPTIDLKDGDIRKKLILHASNPHAFAPQLAEQEKKTDSEFERQVLQRLTHAGYRVIPQWPVGAYRIDLVVEGAGKRLAVECDGDRWHPIEKLEEDMARQAILERLGWRFVRIRGSQFFRDPDKAMATVFARLDVLEIPREGLQDATDRTSRDSKELQERIIRRAAELRQEWTIVSKQTYTPSIKLHIHR